MNFEQVEHGSILGINYSGDHDAALAIVDKTGRINQAFSIERFTRIKSDSRFPTNIVNAIPWDKLEFVALSTRAKPLEQNKTSHFLSELLTTVRSSEIEHDKKFFDFVEKIPIPVHWVDHQNAHAASAVFTSGFCDSAVFTYDGGMYNSPHFGSIQRFSFDSGLTSVDSFPNKFHPKITTFYSFITGILGFIPNRHEGKVTGLAAHGSPNKQLRSIFERWFLQDYSNIESAMRWNFSHSTKVPALLTLDTSQIQDYREELKPFKSQDIAYEVQKMTESHVLAILYRAEQEEVIRKSDNLCLAGGLFSNVKLNMEIAKIGFNHVWVCPAMGDEGTALGAALHEFHKSKQNKSNNFNTHRIQNVFLGPVQKEKISDSWLEKFGIEHERLTKPTERLAEILSNGFEVAIYRGRGEFGPRALGNRSIIAPAIDKDINVTLNKKLRRTEFMPFAPIMLAKYAKESFEEYENAIMNLSFMTCAVQCKEEFTNNHPAVVHVDRTARPQLVDSSDAFMYELLEAYNEKTGRKALINTSFNVHEEPIVESLDDALRGFFISGLSYLFLWPNILIDIEKNPKARIDFLIERDSDTVSNLQSRERIALLELERSTFLENAIQWKKERDQLLKDRDSLLESFKEVVLQREYWVERHSKLLRERDSWASGIHGSGAESQ